MKPIVPVNPATPEATSALERVLRMVERREVWPSRDNELLRDPGEGIIRQTVPSKSAKRGPRKGRQ